jgi:hypothetical protein
VSAAISTNTDSKNVTFTAAAAVSAGGRLRRATAAALALTPVLLALTPALVALALGRIPAA